MRNELDELGLDSKGAIKEIRDRLQNARASKKKATRMRPLKRGSTSAPSHDAPFVPPAARHKAAESPATALRKELQQQGGNVGQAITLSDSDEDIEEAAGEMADESGPVFTVREGAVYFGSATVFLRGPRSVRFGADTLVLPLKAKWADNLKFRYEDISAVHYCCTNPQPFIAVIFYEKFASSSLVPHMNEFQSARKNTANGYENVLLVPIEDGSKLKKFSGELLARPELEDKLMEATKTNSLTLLMGTPWHNIAKTHESRSAKAKAKKYR